MQKNLLNNINVSDIKEAEIISEEILQAILALLDTDDDVVKGDCLFDFLHVAKTKLAVLAKKEDSEQVLYNSSVLFCFSRLYLFLIEETDWLQNLSEQEIADVRKEVENICGNMRIYAEAAQILSEGKEDNYVGRFLTKVQNTGYIHKQDKSFKTILTLFDLDPNLFGYIPEFIDILLMKSQHHWISSGLRENIVVLLEAYIRHTTNLARFTIVSDSRQSKERISQIVKALSAQLLLYSDKDQIDYYKNRTLLYRFASYLPTAKADVLLRNAYKCLIGAIDDKQLEFGWDHIKSPGVVAALMAYDKDVRPSKKLSYRSDKVNLSINAGSIALSPNDIPDDKLTKCIPSTTKLWNNCQVYLESAPNYKITKSTTRLTEYYRWWKEMENTLFYERVIKKNVQQGKATPSTGDSVFIIIDDVLDAEQGVFHATLKDDKYEGDGYICIKDDIVAYDIRCADLKYILLNGCRESKSGLPYLFEAYVAGTKGNLLHFSMAKYIEDDWKESDISNYGTITDAVVTYKNQASAQCICVTENGQSIQITDEEGLIQVGDMIVARVTGTVESKKGLQLLGEYVKHSNATVTQQNAVINLLVAYSRGDIYDGQYIETEQQNVEETIPAISKDYVAEMINIIDREAYLSKELLQRFNLLQLAGTLSRLIDDAELEEYYTICKKQQITLQDFGTNNVISLEQLQELEEIPEAMVEQFPVLKLRRAEIHAINSLDKPEDNAKILQVLNDTDSLELKNLCSLVLSYNFLLGFKMEGERNAILANISKLMNVKLEIQEAKLIGEENETTEFKTSVIFVANAEHKIIASPTEQMRVILKEINAFVNTKGGTLYIGVNNLGYAVGVSDDMEWFQQNPGKVGNVSDKDTYIQYVTNNIYKVWPHINSLIQVSQPACNGRFVVAIEVQPSLEPIQLDGIYYYRVGTETRPVTKEGIKDFLKRRPAQFEACNNKGIIP